DVDVLSFELSRVLTMSQAHKALTLQALRVCINDIIEGDLKSNRFTTAATIEINRGTNDLSVPTDIRSETNPTTAIVGSPEGTNPEVPPTPATPLAGRNNAPPARLFGTAASKQARSVSSQLPWFRMAHPTEV